MGIHLMPQAIADLAKLDTAALRRIIKRLAWLSTNINTIESQSLTGNLSHLFKFRVGDYRILYEIVDETLFVHRIGHRREVYD